MLYSVTRRTLIGHWLNQLRSRRSSTISSRLPSTVLYIIRYFARLTDSRYTKALDNIKALRKERVADLKAEQERLESLSREKAHADKLKERIKEMNENIAARTAEYEDLRAQYEQQVRSNQILNDTGSKFREIYLKADQLTQRKERYQEELNLAKENLQEIPGTWLCPFADKISS